MNTILGKKAQQTQAFLANGNRIPVTLVLAQDNPIIGLKTLEKDGYTAVQVGLGKVKKPTKPLLGQAKKAHLPDVPQFIREIRVDANETFQLGETIKVEEVLKPGDIVDVTGHSKGKGFAGGVKRYHFKGGPRTHGQSDRERAPGSIGQTTTPGRVYKGKRMAGNMGHETVTVQNLLVVDVNSEKKTVLLKGLVPGIFGGMITITKKDEVKEKNFVPLFKLEESQKEVTLEVIEDVAKEQETQEEVKAEAVGEAKEEEVSQEPEGQPGDQVKKEEEETK